MANIQSVSSLLAKSFVNPRKSIDASPHFVPFHLAVLDRVIGRYLEGVNVEEFRQLIVSEMQLRISKKVHVVGDTLYAGKTRLTSNNFPSHTPSLVFEGTELQGVLYPNFRAVRDGLTTSVLNKQMAIYLKRDPKVKRSTGFDTGHTIASYDGKVLAAVPSLEKVNRVISAMTSSQVGSSIMLADDPELAGQIVENILDESNKLKQEFKVHVEYGKVVEATLSKEFKTGLLKVGANIVLIQEREDNQGLFAKQEGKFISAIASLLKKVNFSNNLEEQVLAQVAARYSKKKKLPDTSKTVKVPLNVPTAKTNRVTQTKQPVVKAPVKPRVNKSLAALQVLLDKHLQDVISANMGDQGYPGGQRKILNYRTGRFAASAKVARLSQSREGMITAFYTYMKNPYQTFEPGFRQGSPKTRDPKLLISKSIREIAATLVNNRMRAVSI